ncbi:biotin--protein ligase [Amia ocellicauda]|uniref:biotin--protein ligase n=1 Tax=Amia ocellicauda TaxID=2972642 RepID=UPI003464A719
MLITLCYVYLWVRYQRCYTVVIRRAVRRLYDGSSSFTFCVLKQGQLEKRQLSGEQSRNKHSASVPDDRVCLKLGSRVFYTSEPQVCDDLSKWTLLLGSPLVSLDPGARAEIIAFVIEAAHGQEAALNPLPPPSKKILKWSDYCLPLACSPGQPFKAVAEASLDNFSRLGVAFMEDTLQMDNGMVPEKIVSVSLRESALKELAERQMDKKNPTELTSETETPGKEICGFPVAQSSGQRAGGVRWQASPEPEGQRSSETGEKEGTREQGQEKEKEKQETDATKDHHKEGHHLHLSSCHECLELESSTIESVKFASAENIPDLPDDYTGSAGEEVESFLGQSRRVNFRGKPPNVLVYTGQESAQAQGRYQQVRALLTECIDMDSYVVYPLRQEQVLSQPWLENAVLLVLASEEPLTSDFSQRFLSYLSLGGRILGLSSSFCFGSLSIIPKDSLRNRIHRLSFTKADDTELELTVLTSGGVFVREPTAQSESEVWGQLTGPDKDPMIVRLLHGERGGEAILCQARLETQPDSEDVQGPEDFDKLKMSNALRYEVLSEILSSLGLSCELSQVPPPSPLYLLSTSQDAKDRFLKWLGTSVDGEGVLKSPVVSMKVVSSAEPPTELKKGHLALLTQPPEPPSDQFSLDTYTCNLQTRTLGHTVLYAEVTPTTMDLLEGLMLQLPQEMGLIAIAARQTQGKGRGGNAWLSPLGCAMFTLHVRVPVCSPLGQRIPFLQHLAALAVVEAVRGLPGYEDIDLRVKWPNDIYYSDLMKLGGVLVTSTLMGLTFHALIGCGFNVSNSNPTICINDLIDQHNKEKGAALAPLSTTQLIARSVTVLEQLIASFQEQGPEGVVSLYYKRWVHSGTQVRLGSETGPQVAVVGLDDNGFLQVESQEQGVVSVQPDGNSFDMLKNLIVTKQR